MLLFACSVGTNLLDTLHLPETASMYLFGEKCCCISDADFKHCLPVLFCTAARSLPKAKLLPLQFYSSKQLLRFM